MKSISGDILGMIVTAIDGGGTGFRNSKVNDTNLKYDTLSKEHELLKEQLEKVLKELATEKETKKLKIAKTEDGRNSEIQTSKNIVHIVIYIYNLNRE